jgi:hypothetical protein
MWASDVNDAPEAAPEILVSSRDGAPVPRIAGAVKLAAVAQAHGWTVRQTYALAAVPERPRKAAHRLASVAAHRLASVAVRLARGAARGWAVWHRINEGSWLFVCAFIGIERCGWRAGAGRGSILEAVSAP